MNYYNEIKNELVKNRIYNRVKDYSKNKNDLETYYKVGKLLFDAGKCYGEGIIKEYSNKLTYELGKGYGIRNLWLMLKFYQFKEKMQTLSAQLSWSHYCELLSLEDKEEINYYVRMVELNSLSVRELRNKIKLKEYNRLPKTTKQKLIGKEETSISDFIKDPIILNNDYVINKEYALKQAIFENIDDFLEQLGNGFSYIKNEYKIKVGDNYNYIDLLLFNYIYNAFVVVELKVTKLKYEHIGQIEYYMNYIDQNLRTFNQNETIGIIICKEKDKYVVKYCSNNKINVTTYIFN